MNNSIMIRPSLSPKPKILHRLIPRLKMANLLTLDEDNFENLIGSIEKNPVFKKYYISNDEKNRVISYKRYAHTSLASHFLELKEETARQSESPDIELLLSEKKEMIDICQRIGRQNFETYFLFNEGHISLDTISQACHLSVEEIEKTMDLVNNVAIQTEFFEPMRSSASAHVHYTCLGAIEKDKSNEFVINYSSLKYARGRYVIDYKKMESLKKDPAVSKMEYKKLKNLVKSMELVNMRKSILCRVIETILKKQRVFLEENNREKLIDMTLCDMSKELGVHTSTICRAISRKAVITPWNEELPLKSFLAKGSVHAVKGKIWSVISEEEKKIRHGCLSLPYSDEDIKKRLLSDHHLTIATRTVAKYRSQIKIPNVYSRMQAYKQCNNKNSKS